MKKQQVIAMFFFLIIFTCFFIGTSYAEKWQNIPSNAFNKIQKQPIFLSTFATKPVGYIDIWELMDSDTRNIFSQMGICKKIGTSSTRKITCITQAESNDFENNCSITIEHAARGNFTGSGYNEILLDIYDSCEAHANNYGNMYLLQNGKIVREYPREGDHIDFWGSVKTASGKTKLLVLSGFCSTGSCSQTLSLCDFTGTTALHDGKKCEILMEGESNDISYNYPAFDVSLLKVEKFDVNGDNIEDLLLSMVAKQYVTIEIPNEINLLKRLLLYKPMFVEFVFDGEHFKVSQKTRSNLEEWKKIMREVLPPDVQQYKKTLTK